MIPDFWSGIFAGQGDGDSIRRPNNNEESRAGLDRFDFKKKNDHFAMVVLIEIASLLD